MGGALTVRRRVRRPAAAEASALTGAPDPRLARELVRQVIEALGLSQKLTRRERRERVAAAKAALAGLAPEGAVEGLMAGQMIATHAAAMACLTHAMTAGVDNADAQAVLRRAERLLFVYARQTETLLRARKASPRAAEGKEAWRIDGVAFEPPPWMSLLAEEAQAWAREQLTAAARKGLPAPERTAAEAE
jgi:hypothetical protein